MKTEKPYILLVLGGFILMSCIIFSGFINQIPASDEMVFIRLTDNLPKYESYKEWWSLDGKTSPSEVLGLETPNPAFNRYNQLVWWHPPVANYLSYPLVKLLYSEDSLDTIRQGVKNLRVVAWLMTTMTIGCIGFLLWKRLGNSLNLLLATIPLLLTLPFYNVFGNNWFYHETFMCLFLSIALVLRVTKYRKYIYIPLALMVGSKITGFIFLIPFVLENKKTAFCSLILLPYFIQCYFGSGNFFYPFSRAFLPNEAGIVGASDILIRRWIWIKQNFTLLPLALPLLFTSIGVSVYTAYLVVKRKAGFFYPSLLLMSIIIGLTWGAGYYQLVIIGYFSALVLSMILPLKIEMQSHKRKLEYA